MTASGANSAVVSMKPYQIATKRRATLLESVEHIVSRLAQDVRILEGSLQHKKRTLKATGKRIRMALGYPCDVHTRTFPVVA